MHCFLCGQMHWVIISDEGYIHPACYSEWSEAFQSDRKVLTARIPRTTHRSKMRAMRRLARREERGAMFVSVFELQCAAFGLTIRKARVTRKDSDDQAIQTTGKDRMQETSSSFCVFPATI